MSDRHLEKSISNHSESNVQEKSAKQHRASKTDEAVDPHPARVKNVEGGSNFVERQHSEAVKPQFDDSSSEDLIHAGSLSNQTASFSSPARHPIAKSISYETLDQSAMGVKREATERPDESITLIQNHGVALNSQKTVEPIPFPEQDWKRESVAHAESHTLKYVGAESSDKKRFQSNLLERPSTNVTETVRHAPIEPVDRGLEKERMPPQYSGMPKPEIPENFAKTPHAESIKEPSFHQNISVERQATAIQSKALQDEMIQGHAGVNQKHHENRDSAGVPIQPEDKSDEPYGDQLLTQFVAQSNGALNAELKRMKEMNVPTLNHQANRLLQSIESIVHSMVYNELEIKLEESLLPGTRISIQREGQSLAIHVHTSHEKTYQALEGARLDLHTGLLSSGLANDVNIQIRYEVDERFIREGQANDDQSSTTNVIENEEGEKQQQRSPSSMQEPEEDEDE